MSKEKDFNNTKADILDFLKNVDFFMLAPQVGYSPDRGNVRKADKRVMARNEP